jgi:AcrR family transcriptional regulator
MIRPTREDAALNRRRLLLATRDAVAEGGPGVSVRSIADRAGVGVTTLYRHFPSKDALVDAVSVNRWATMTYLARAGSNEDDPLTSIVGLLETFTRMVTVDEGFIAATGLRVGRTPAGILPLKATFDPAFAALWSRAQRRNDVRQGADPRDAMELAGMIRDSDRRMPMLLTLVNGICTEAVNAESLLAERLGRDAATARWVQ